MDDGSSQPIEFVRDGGACAAVVLGLPLCAAALGTWAWGLPDTSAGWSRAAAALFLVAGLVLVFGRSRLVLDPVSRTATDRTTLLVPLRVKALSLDGFDRVAILRTGERRPSSEGEPPGVCRVVLEGPGGQLPLELASPVDARNRADLLAARLGLKVDDRTGSLPASSAPLSATATPGNRDGEAFRVDVPSAGFGWRFLVVLSAGLALPVLLLVAALALRRAPDQDEAQRTRATAVCLALAALVLPFALVPPLSAASRSERLELFPGRLRLHRSTLFRRGLEELPAAEVREAYLRRSRDGATRFCRPPGWAVCVRHAGGALELGTGLARARLEALATEIEAWRRASGAADTALPAPEPSGPGRPAEVAHDQPWRPQMPPPRR